MNVQCDKALRDYNTLALQAHARAFANVSDDADLLAALEWARTHSLPVVPLGEGSNVVLSGNLNALVLRLNNHGIEVLETNKNAVKLRVAAGENWHQLVQWSLQKGFYGLQNLALIPGTVGAAPIQNIGAYGVELNSVLSRVHAIRIADSERIVLDREACAFSYRDSVFKNDLADQLVITSIELELSLHPACDITYPALAQYFRTNSSINLTPQAVFDAVVIIRRSKLPDPSVEPNAGSFFKNPVIDASAASRMRAKFPALPQYPQLDGTVKLPAAWMIEYCGWKGYRCENLGVHGQHALVLVNYGNDSGAQLLKLAAEIGDSIRAQFNIDLQIEPRMYGHYP